MISLDMPAPLPDHAITQVLRDAEANMADGAKPKVLVYDAMLRYFADAKAFDLAPELTANLDMTIMLSGDDAAGLIECVRDTLGAHAVPLTDEQIIAALYEDGKLNADRHDVAAKLIYAMLAFKKPIAANMGKTLAKYGITALHTDAIQPNTAPRSEADFAEAATPPPAPPAPPGAGVVEVRSPPDHPAVGDFDMAAMLGTSEVVSIPLPPPPAPPVPATPPAAPSTPTPPAAEADPNSLRGAFMSYREAMSVKDEELAATLGISRSTLHNLMTGKTQRVKCTFEQAQKVLADVDVRISKLMQAAEVFRAIKP